MRASRKSLFKGFDACGPPANHSAKSLEFPRMAKVISRMVWNFRGWRNSFPERFGISAHGESRFPNGLVFPRMAKVVSQRVWSFRVLRKLFPNSLGLVVAKIWKLTVQRNGHVRLLGHYYSVPHTYVGKKESMRKNI